MLLVGLKNSLLLVLATGGVALIVGLLTSVAAWRSGHVLGRLLPLLMLAVPPYILVYCVSEVFDYLDPWWTAVVVLGLCNSAFVHAPLTSHLSRNGDGFFEAALVATGSRRRAFLSALTPALKGALPMGLAIVACEAISDLAVCRYYGIQSLAVIIYNSWAANISLFSVLPALGLVALMGLCFTLLGKRVKDIPLASRQRSTNRGSAVLACVPAIIVLGFCVITLARWLSRSSGLDLSRLGGELLNSGILVGAAIGGCCLLAGPMVAWGSSKGLVRASLFLYSIPGSVLAVLLLPSARWLPYLVVLAGAILIRFSCLMVVNTDSAMQSHARLCEMLTASCPPGRAKWETLRLVSPGFITGLCLVSLDVLRELPMSMLLQPYNFSTLAMRIHYLSATEMLSAVAPESLVLLAVSLALTLGMVRVQYAFSR